MAHLSLVVGRYFDAWIRLDTWDSGHALDNERFFRFVEAVARYSHRPPVSREIRTLILKRWRGQRAGSSLRKAADRFVARYDTLLAYEKTRGFPNPLIERTDILLFYLRLTSPPAIRDEEQ